MSTTEGDLDIEVSHELEEGELVESDVEEGTYIPLARPETFNPPSLVNMQIQDELSDEPSHEESSGSESDEEPRRRAKRTKLRLRRSHQQQQQQTKRDKYNVWCKTVQEDLLTEDMGSIDVTKKSDYGVESYDYTIKYRLDDNYISKKVFSNDQIHNRDNTSNKRRHTDRTNVKLRLGKKVNCNQPREEKQKPRYLPNLTVTTEDPIENIAEEIAEKLSESKKELVVRILQVVGASKAIELYKETQRVEADGGMLVMNGTRRRTSGGIYFFLLKHDEDISQAMISQIFVEDRKTSARKVKKALAKNRQKIMEELKQSLTDSELPSLLSRGEATVQTEHGSNPPPSPATDARECSSDTDAPQSPSRPQASLPDRTDRDPRQLHTYEDDDDFLEVMCNEEMDLF
ncbi:PREDICTED: phosphorylated adapter RNA export protein [Papilio xuthus]|uniref:Phosphorylated adapter RNA export protein n=1 Tax=Papilio xuthus TaxID=66420 RepID=A0A194QCV4_PAPXU|nr:PREDICTED: phosphorylated adapter RNA export protein [Papilio xuthus]KPJ03249.1 Phosphorylated adapter RNA export protein [Papilio xuthus]